ncbi:MAG: hypothetical protein CO189_06490 [candidate division Zixibacteria bacterium CG_4_9_14_3_um_filter_46_8]|nr:MAG: hypothetical protein CO189_06490 [candidate division Zixibacteria bacterium CG_4_9_14_3_um_filter_46_8]
MPRFNFTDFKFFEKTPTSPNALQCRVSDLIFNSWNARCKVDTVNAETGEYRIILQGTLDWDNYYPEDYTK